MCLKADHEHLGDVTGTEDFVDSCEFVRLMGGEVRGERALLSTSSPQELTGGTRSDSVQACYCCSTMISCSG